jgi:hypothetical protein
MPKPKGHKRNRGLNQGRQKQEWTVPCEDSPAAQKAKMEAWPARMQRAADVRCGLAEVERMLSNMPSTRASKWRALHGKMWVEDPCMRGFELGMVGGNVEVEAHRPG